MKLRVVDDLKSRKLFLDVARVLYRDDPHWVCPLDMEIEGIFDPQTNVFFKNGEAQRWILQNDKGELIGRVAAFINRLKAHNYSQPTGGMGFFECIDDQEAADLLFNTCRDWLRSRGMEAMDGPINFSENDNYWGLLVDGYMHPSYGMPYNFPYYQKLFENYGFTNYFEQVSNHLNLYKPFPERFWKIAEWVMSRPGFRFEHFKLADAKKYILDMKTVYDKAWVFHENFTPLEEKFLLESLRKAKSFLVEEFIWFVYHEDEPVAFLVMFPDVNQVLKRFNGKMNLLNKIRFVLFKKFEGFSRARITIMGVSPQYQRMGVESGIFWHLRKIFDTKPQYTEIELSWVGDFNLKMRKLHESVGADFAKKHVTYRKIFSETLKDQKYTAIPVDTKDKFLDEVK